jgi:hypothetical protein
LIEDPAAAAGVFEATFGLGDGQRRLAEIGAAAFGVVGLDALDGDGDRLALVAADAAGLPEERGDALDERGLERPDGRQRPGDAVAERQPVFDRLAGDDGRIGGQPVLNGVEPGEGGTDVGIGFRTGHHTSLSDKRQTLPRKHGYRRPAGC